MNETQRLAWIESLKRVRMFEIIWSCEDAENVEALQRWLESSEGRSAAKASEIIKQRTSHLNN